MAPNLHYTTRPLVRRSLDRYALGNTSVVSINKDEQGVYRTLKLKEAREHANYTQESLVNEIQTYMDCSLRHYQNIEYGKKIPRMPLGLLICKLCGVDPHEVDEWKIDRI